MKEMWKSHQKSSCKWTEHSRPSPGGTGPRGPRALMKGWTQRTVITEQQVAVDRYFYSNRLKYIYIKLSNQAWAAWPRQQQITSSDVQCWSILRVAKALKGSHSMGQRQPLPTPSNAGRQPWTAPKYTKYQGVSVKWGILPRVIS